MAVDPELLEQEFDDWTPEQQKAFLRRHKRPIGARRTIGRRFIDARDLPHMGAAIEKRGRKALRRLKDAQRQQREA